MKLENLQGVKDFFFRQLKQAKENQNVDISAFVEMYVVQLLEKAMRTSNLFVQGNKQREPQALALMLAQALSAPSDSEKIKRMQSIGDQSLYLSGFFSDSLARKTVDIDYYVAMGSNAYRHVSSIMQDRAGQKAPFEIFDELSLKFNQLVSLITEISEISGSTDDQDLLRLYERWLMTKSDHLSERLREKGIIPIVINKEDLH